MKWNGIRAVVHPREAHKHPAVNPTNAEQQQKKRGRRKTEKQKNKKTKKQVQMKVLCK